MAQATVIDQRPSTKSQERTAPRDARGARTDGIVVETQNLVKEYNGLTAVRGLNFQLKESEIFGLLGPNGAGKTTTILMLMGLTEPTSGSVSVIGYDPVRQPLQVVGLVPNPLPLAQSLLLIWPQVVGLVALMAICFAIAYVKFMTQEVRSL
jgi:ABC-type uncharacterized transport system ATPase subunit